MSEAQSGAAMVADGPTAGRAILDVENLTKHYPQTSGLLRRSDGGVVKAVDDVSFSIAPGETFGLIGESGCGKTTLARLLVQLIPPSSGRILFNGEDITVGSGRKELARRIQMVFQDPSTSLNRRKRVLDIVGEPLYIHGSMGRTEVRARVGELLELVGLDPRFATRLPHEFSGGQRQRIAIARALALEPQLLILDEPVASLDVSIQAQVIELLRSLQQELGVSYLFIAHDLSVVRHIADRVAIMYLGRIAETGPERAIYDTPAHPYTRALLSAVPVPDPSRNARETRILLGGDLPNPSNPPTGCRFRTRCWKAEDLCATEEPQLEARRVADHRAACHFPEQP